MVCQTVFACAHYNITQPDCKSVQLLLSWSEARFHLLEVLPRAFEPRLHERSCSKLARNFVHWNTVLCLLYYTCSTRPGSGCPLGPLTLMNFRLLVQFMPKLCLTAAKRGVESLKVSLLDHALVAKAVEQF